MYTGQVLVFNGFTSMLHICEGAEWETAMEYKYGMSSWGKSCMPKKHLSTTCHDLNKPHIFFGYGLVEYHIFLNIPSPILPYRKHNADC